MFHWQLIAVSASQANQLVMWAERWWAKPRGRSSGRRLFGSRGPEAALQPESEHPGRRVDVGVVAALVLQVVRAGEVDGVRRVGHEE